MLKKKKKKKYNALKLDVLCLGRVIAKNVGLKGGCRLVKSRGSGKEEEKMSGTNGEFQKAERTESVTKRDGDTSTPLGRDRNSRQPCCALCSRPSTRSQRRSRRSADYVSCKWHYARPVSRGEPRFDANIRVIWLERVDRTAFVPGKLVNSTPCVLSHARMCRHVRRFSSNTSDPLK